MNNQYMAHRFGEAIAEVSMGMASRISTVPFDTFAVLDVCPRVGSDRGLVIVMSTRLRSISTARACVNMDSAGVWGGHVRVVAFMIDSF
jgi:hypothetical protein